MLHEDFKELLILLEKNEVEYKIFNKITHKNKLFIFFSFIFKKNQNK